ncbi:limonene-1,2-epoxide hydrolase family protein [Tsukamurella sputi]|uniref:limonene-1,2-epoxide hydrolase family protein n=1 Tax=Tsukamurella sputi TaxID=2591848 RepID=UPI0013158715|nr:limonene-1,2-epoxide hydrolase family protein [Tsukamurella sputi]
MRRPRPMGTIDTVNNAPLWSPQDVAERFVDALGSGDYEIAEHLLAKNVVYRRTGGRPLRGRAAIVRHFRWHARTRVAMQAVLLASEQTGRAIAVTERVTALVYGPLRLQFQVRGVFEVDGGRIVAWRDDVDTAVVARAAARAVAGVFYAPARPTLPRAVI